MRCPVCGMKIEKSSAKEVEYNGKTYFVASEDCKTRFLADTAKYIGIAEHSGHEQHQHKHGCC
ncbi:MAG: YHS domain-containing protein [Bacteroidota bacterium]|nr:YHS domain-containing protein [Bacteroidota bacterium]